MKSIDKYIRYTLHENRLRTLIITLIFIVTVATVSSPITYLDLPSIYLGFLCTVIPLFHISPFKNKRNLDTLFAMPISREKLAIASFVTGYIEIFLIYTVFFIYFGIHFLNSTSWSNALNIILYYAASLLAGVIIYSILSFLMIKANTAGDGFWISLMWIGVVAIISLTLLALTNDIRYFSETVMSDILSKIWKYWSNPYSVLTFTTNYFSVKTPGIDQNIFVDLFGFKHGAIEIVCMISLWSLVAIGAAYGYFRTFSKYKAYQAGEISSSWWGYKLLIPLYGYCFLFFVTYEMIFLVVLIYISMLIGYFIYRRSFKLKKCDLICLALGIIPTLITPELIAKVSITI